MLSKLRLPKLYEKLKGEKICIQWNPIGSDKEIL